MQKSVKVKDIRNFINGKKPNDYIYLDLDINFSIKNIELNNIKQPEIVIPQIASNNQTLQELSKKVEELKNEIDLHRIRENIYRATLFKLKLGSRSNSKTILNMVNKCLDKAAGII